MSIRFAPTPASSSSRLVTGDDQVVCCTRGAAWLLPRASGAVVALPPPMHDVHNRCSSQKKLNLFRADACQRQPPVDVLPRAIVGRLRPLAARRSRR